MLANGAPARRSGSYRKFERGAESFGLAVFALAGLVGVLALGTPALGQGPQANWWESLTGSGTPDYTGRRQEDRARDRAAEQNEVLDDLRPDAMPMRSDQSPDDVFYPESDGAPMGENPYQAEVIIMVKSYRVKGMVVGMPFSFR